MQGAERDSLQALEEVLRRNPTDRAALLIAESAARRTGSWGMLADLWSQAFQHADPKRKLEFALKLGELHRDTIGFPDEAAHWFLEAMTVDPTSETAFTSLGPLCEQGRHWDLLVKALELRAQAFPEEAAALKLREATLLEQELDEITLASELYQEVFEAACDNRSAYDRLVDIYAGREDWAKLAGVYERMAAATTDDAERTDLIRKVAILKEEVLGDKQGAVECYRQVARNAPADLGALGKLEKLYEQEQRGDELAGVLRQMLGLAKDSSDKLPLLERIAALNAGELGRPEAAAAAWKEILVLDPGHPEAARNLEEYHIRKGEWAEVLAFIDRRLAKARERRNLQGIVEGLLARGALLAERLNDPLKAEEAYRAALEMFPSHQGAADRLVNLLEATGRFEPAVELLVERARSESAGEPQSRLLARAAQMARERLGRPERAIELYEAALVRNPSLPEALSPLSDLYAERGEWVKALPLLEMIRTGVEEKGTPEQLAAHYRRMGTACRNLGKREEALGFYRRAYDREPGHAETLEALGQLNLEQGNRDLAASYYRRYLETLESTGQTERIGEVMRMLGRLEAAGGSKDRARDAFLKVLEQNPDDAEAVRSLAQMSEAQGAPEEAIAWWKRLAALSQEPLEKWNAWMKAGELAALLLKDHDAAVAAYHEALAVQPRSVSAMAKLLELHVADKDFTAAVRMLQRLAETEEAPSRRAAYVLTIGTIQKEHLADARAAAAAFELSFSINPERLEALRLLIETLTATESWSELEAAYRRLAAVATERRMVDLLALVQKGLGELYELHLARPDEAIEAYRAAAKLKPEDTIVHELLARLYEGAGRTEEALAEHRTLVCMAPGRADSYRRMAAHLDSLGRRDEAWFCLSVLASIDKLRKEERRWVEGRRPTSLIPNRQPMTPETWAEGVLSKAEDPRTGLLLALVDRAMGDQMEARAFSDLGLRKRDRLDLARSSPLAAAFNHAASLLGVELPGIFVLRDASHIEIAATNPPIIVAGGELASNCTPGELAFLAARNLAYFHPTHVPAVRHAPEMLKTLVAVARTHALAGGRSEFDEDPDIVELALALGKKLSAEEDDLLARLVNQLVKPSIGRWLSGLDLTSAHAGLLACMDFEAASAALRSDPATRSRLPKDDQAAELALYAMSDEFHLARQALGLKLKG
jgi:tetratricopeptide (TPR) repeat protein